MSFYLRSALPPDLPSNLIPLHPCDTTSHLSPTTTTTTAPQTILNKVETPKPPTTTTYREMDYCHMLNKVLPKHIKAIGYTEVTSDFNARFSAKSRTYRYFFLQKNLNIEGVYVYTYIICMCVYHTFLIPCYTVPRVYICIPIPYTYLYHTLHYKIHL